MKNIEFLRKHGKPGCIGLVGGTAALDRAIRFAQRHITVTGKHSLWSHALIFQGERIDGQQWVLESDLDFGGMQFKNGVQENRIDKYGDEKSYPNLAVLDFGLDAAKSRKIVAAGLDLVSQRSRYAAGGVLKTYIAVLRKKLHEEKKRDETFCSSFVAALYSTLEIKLAPGVAMAHVTPEHLSATPVPHERMEVVRG